MIINKKYSKLIKFLRLKSCLSLIFKNIMVKIINIDDFKK